MPTITAPRAPNRVRPAAPLQTFFLRGGSAAIYARAAEVDRLLWGETFSGQVKDLAFYELLERTMTAGFTYRYLVLRLPHDEPVALQPLILVDQDLSLSLGETTRNTLGFLRRFFPRLLRARMLLAGCLVGNGHLGVVPGFARRTAVALLAEALDAFAKSDSIPFLTIKDFPAAERAEMAPLRAAGYTRLDGFPPLQLALDFDSFEDYLGSRLSRISRKGLRRKLRAAAQAQPPITLEVRNNCRTVIDEIYPLYLAVAQRSEVEFEVFSRDYFLDASLTMPDRCRFFIWRQNGKAIAFSYCTIHGDTIFDNDLGLDYAVAHDLHLYYLSFRDILEWALRHGYRTYRTSPFNYEPKMRLRLELEPVDLFVRHRSPIWNFLLRVFAPRFSPVQSDPVLRRHFSARS